MAPAPSFLDDSNRRFRCCIPILIFWVAVFCLLISNYSDVSISVSLSFTPSKVFIPRPGPHEFRWIDIQKNEYSKYFTEYELKSIKESNAECKGIPHLGLRCCVGGTSAGGAIRWAPQSCSKKNIFKRFDFSPLSEEEIYSIADIAMKLDNNSIIVSIGDSVQNQITDLMECNLYNHGFDQIYPKSYNETQSSEYFGLNYTAYQKENMWPTSVSLNERKFCNNGSEKCVVIRFLHAHRVNVTALNNFCDWGDIYLINWSLHYALDEVYELHLNAVFDEMKNCDESKNKVFVWRERTSQHFFGPGGYWDFQRDYYFGRGSESIDKSIWSEWYEQFTKDGKCEEGIKMYNQSTEEEICHSDRSNVATRIKIDKFGCWPISYAGNVEKGKYGFRNVVMDVANSSGIRTQIVYHDSKPKVNNSDDSVNLFFIPFKDVTHSLWDHHPRECTHYCTTPYWAEYIFHTLYLAICAVGNVSVV